LSLPKKFGLPLKSEDFDNLDTEDLDAVTGGGWGKLVLGNSLDSNPTGKVGLGRHFTQLQVFSNKYRNVHFLNDSPYHRRI
jgi:hypothetical protein